MTARELIQSQCFNCIFSYTEKLQSGKWEIRCTKGYTQISYANCPDFQPYKRSSLDPRNNKAEIKQFK